MADTSNTDSAMGAIANRSPAFEAAIVQGDLKNLSADERLHYYRSVCESLGLNPLTKPFEYITLNGKLTLYARKDCTEQLRSTRKISVKIVAREVVEGCYVVTAQAFTPDGRTDESIGAVPIDGLKGEARSNAMMKAETKAKRRVSLSICGLGMLDETEVESIPPGIATQPEPMRPSIPDKPFDVNVYMASINDAETLEELKAAWFVINADKKLTADVKKQLGKLKDERKAKLDSSAAGSAEALFSATENTQNLAAMR